MILQVCQPGYWRMATYVTGVSSTGKPTEPADIHPAQARDAGPPLQAVNERPDPLAPPEGYGIKRERQHGPSVADLTVCHLDGCDHAPATLFTLGDLQEHVFTLGICRCHLLVYKMSRKECETCRLRGSSRYELKVLKEEQVPDAPDCGGVEAAIERLFPKPFTGGDGQFA